MTRTAEHITDFSFESVLFQSDRQFETVDLRNSVTDLDIFEHVNKPYLTATLALQDSLNFVAGADILGAETITITLKSNRKNTSPITKRFYIDSIVRNARQNDNVQFVVLHLIEDVAYISNLKNISRSYSGKCTDIISKISRGYLNKEVFSTDNDRQSIKIIIPNLNPLEAMQWITNRASTVNGYPFYLMSPFVGEKLKFLDLGSMLTQNSLNEDLPYRYYQGAAQSPNRDIQRRTILEYQQNETEDLFTLIQKGLVGSKYSYLNTVKNTKSEFHFDVTKDLLQPLVQRGIVPSSQPNVMYSPDYVLDEKSFNLLDSRVITQIGGTSAFENLFSYSESDLISDYKLNIISRAMHHFLQKVPLQVDLNGIDFIDGDVNAGAGNIINLEFLKSDPEEKIEVFDTKMTGEYLILATQYMFKRESCKVRLQCAKLGNRRL